MGLSKEAKIKRIMQAWPKCGIATSRWFGKQKISPQLVKKYFDSGWIERIDEGAYCLPGKRPTWAQAVCALQNHLEYKVHISGVTALEFFGVRHSIPMSKTLAYLFGRSKRKLPKWFTNYEWDRETRLTSANLFEDSELGLSQFGIDDYQATISSPERAVFEMIYLITNKFDFEHAYFLFEFLTTLRPRLIQQLLMACKSVKTKRVLLFFADLSNHSWAKKLELSQVNLGSGARHLMPGGKYISKYKITVPESLFHEEGSSYEK